MAKVYGFGEDDVQRISRVVHRVERDGGSTAKPRGRHGLLWPSPWDVGDGNETVDLRPDDDTQSTERAATWGLGDGTFVQRYYRYVFDDDGLVLYGFYWDERYDAYGRKVAISAEVKFIAINVPPSYNCDECSPDLPDILYVTFGGLLSDFGPFNGKWELPWVSDCKWKLVTGDGVIVVRWDGTLGNWLAGATIVIHECFFDFEGGADQCDPYDAYAWTYCNDDSCLNPDSCEDSALSGTCVVSAS